MKQPAQQPAAIRSILLEKLAWNIVRGRIGIGARSCFRATWRRRWWRRRVAWRRRRWWVARKQRRWTREQRVWQRIARNFQCKLIQHRRALVESVPWQRRQQRRRNESRRHGVRREYGKFHGHERDDAFRGRETTSGRIRRRTRAQIQTRRHIFTQLRIARPRLPSPCRER